MHVFRRDSFKRIRPHQQLIKQQSQTVNVHRLIVALLPDDFWGQIFITTTKAIQLLLPYLASEAKIAYLDPLLFINQNVLGLDVPVNQALFMQANYSEDDLHPNHVFLSQAQPGLLTFLHL